MVKYGMHGLTTHPLRTKRMIEDRTIGFYICMPYTVLGK